MTWMDPRLLFTYDVTFMLASSTRPTARALGRTSRFTRRRAHARGVTMNATPAYDALKSKLSEISDLRSISGLAGWDELVMLPSGEGASKARGRAMATLAGVIHERATSKEIGELLEKSATETLQPKDRANRKRAEEEYTKATAVSAELEKRRAELGSRGYQTWVKARESGSYAAFSPVLTEWVALTRESCALVAPEKKVYDAALDDYERGMSSERLREIFAVVRAGVVPLIQKVYAKDGPTALAGRSNPLHGEFDVEKQAALAKAVAVKIGFDLTKGRLDVSVHPFTGGCGPDDVRITTRYKKDDIMEGLTGCIHEAGHSAYEMGRSREYVGQPVSDAHSMGAHESQSLLWERMVGLGEPFMTFLLGELRETFPGRLDDVTPELLYAGFNVVKKNSVIRVESDEVTYPMHVILRTELEMDLLEGTITVDYLPKLWNSKMKEYLNVDVESDKQGVLQDVHWSSGAIGYFPTYIIGQILACQVFNAAKRQIEGLDEQIKQGEFAPLLSWLRTNMHERGSECDTVDELMIKVTGKPLDANEFVEYLNDKYTKLYDL